jgi:hypothetical protein
MKRNYLPRAVVDPASQAANPVQTCSITFFRGGRAPKFSNVLRTANISLSQNHTALIFLLCSVVHGHLRNRIRFCILLPYARTILHSPSPTTITNICQTRSARPTTIVNDGMIRYQDPNRGLNQTILQPSDLTTALRDISRRTKLTHVQRKAGSGTMLFNRFGPV